MPDLVSVSNGAADKAGIPRLLMLAAAIAESNLNATARRPADPSRDAAYWPDVSGGAWQQTVRWSAEYRDWYQWEAPGHPPAQFPGAEVIRSVLARYYDVEHAADVAASQLKAKYRPSEDDAIFKALNRYNWPAGDGAPKGQAQAANYRRGIAEAEKILATSEAPVQPSPIVYEDFRDPEPAGTFAAQPKGIILHGSRSGRAGNPKAQEALGTARYEQSNPAGLGWHVTIGERWVAVHLTPDEWGWNAFDASKHYLAVEIAQATVDEPITDAQIVALADWIKTRVFPRWGDLGYHFPTHAELELWGETGRKDGKTDIYPAGDPRVDAVRNRLYHLLGAPSGEQPVDPPPLPPAPPAPTPAEIRAALVALLSEPDERIVGRYFREKVSELVERIPG